MCGVYVNGRFANPTLPVSDSIWRQLRLFGFLLPQHPFYSNRNSRRLSPVEERSQSWLLNPAFNIWAYLRAQKIQQKRARRTFFFKPWIKPTKSHERIRQTAKKKPQCCWFSFKDFRNKWNLSIQTLFGGESSLFIWAKSPWNVTWMAKTCTLPLHKGVFEKGEGGGFHWSISSCWYLSVCSVAGYYYRTACRGVNTRSQIWEP